MQDVFDATSYRPVVRDRIRDFRRQGKKLTLKRVAEALRIQYTYLSRVLRSEEMHLGEDALYALCDHLEFFPEETEYVLTLRAWEMATHRGRRAYLGEKLNRMRQARSLNASVQEFSTRKFYQEMSYLFDPFTILLHVGLAIKKYRDNPHLLCPALGLTRERIDDGLRRLQQLGFVELSTIGKVIKLNEGAFHYGPDHPLMRVHQSLLRNLSSAHLGRVPEEKKRSFMTTFSGDQQTFERIKERFQVFLKEVESLAQGGADEQAFQMNFDLFPWF